MLYREEAYNEDCEDPGVTDFYVRENPNGATGKGPLFFDAEQMAFRSLSKRRG
jgi:replicative DNA helicase